MTGAVARDLPAAWRDPLVKRRQMILAVLGLAVIASALAAGAIGALPIPLSHVVAALAQRLGIVTHGHVEPMEDAALFAIRLPRVALGIGVGMTLGIAGAALQALFRNPLADPGLIGVSGGAACGAVGCIVLGGQLPLWLKGAEALPLAAFASGLLSTIAVYLVGRSRVRSDISTLLLAGLAINAITTAIVGYPPIWETTTSCAP
jgi:iron complex transport system permease protein